MVWIDGVRLAVVIDARVSRKVGRDGSKRIAPRRDVRLFLLGMLRCSLSRTTTKATVGRGGGYPDSHYQYAPAMRPRISSKFVFACVIRQSRVWRGVRVLRKDRGRRLRVVLASTRVHRGGFSKTFSLESLHHSAHGKRNHILRR